MSKPNIQIWPLDRLIPYEQNIKKHSPASVKRLSESIKEFGWTQPIVVDKTGVIIAGHGRRLAAMLLEHTEVPVWVRDDLDETQVRALRLADNRVVDTEIDTELFRKELATLEFDLGGIFDAKELEFAVTDLGEINTDAFVDDVAAAIDAQTRETQEKAAVAATKPVLIYKVLGFREIPGDKQLVVSRAMAEMERRTGKKGVDAFTDFCRAMWESTEG